MEKLTLVQNLSLPLITAGFDCLIKSQTGSGKTLAYGIPLVQQLAAVEPKVIYSGVMSSGRMWLDLLIKSVIRPSSKFSVTLFLFFKFYNFSTFTKNVSHIEVPT